MSSESLDTKRSGSSIFSAVSVYCERRLLFVFFMGFASGLPFLLSGATLSIWLTEAGVSLTTIGLFALVGTPYNLKFSWAPIIDRVPVPLLSKRLGRRRAWMIVIQTGMMVSIVSLGMTKPESAPGITAFLAFAVAFFSASQDIVIDAYRIDVLDEEQQGAGAAMTQAGYRFGLLSSGAGALYLASYINWSLVYVIIAGLALVGFIAALLAPVPHTDTVLDKTSASMKEWLYSAIIAPFVEFFSRNNVSTALLILAFILLYKFGDAFAGVMANPFYIKIGFTKMEIANVSKIFGVFATLLGVFTGGLIVKRFGVLQSLFYCGILQMLSNLMFAAQAVVGAKVAFLFLTIGIENLSGGMGSAAFVAYLSMLCNTSYTGTQYALFTSFMAFARTWLSASSGWVAEQTNWTTFFIISTFVSLPGLLLLIWMMKKLPMTIQTGHS